MEDEIRCPLEYGLAATLKDLIEDGIIDRKGKISCSDFAEHLSVVGYIL